MAHECGILVMMQESPPTNPATRVESTSMVLCVDARTQRATGCNMIMVKTHRALDANVVLDNLPKE